jgi:DNA-directed RNA polymerase omega subunit
MTTPTSKIPERLDSKFRFVLVAAERAEQLMQGARPRLESTTGKKPTRIAQEEVRRELVAWDYGSEAEVEEGAPAVEEETEEAPAETEDEVH